MPELPEVETMCRCVAAAVGCRIRDVQRPKSRLQSILIWPRLGQFRRQAVGRTITGIRRLGKRVVLELDGANVDRPHPGAASRKLSPGGNACETASGLSAARQELDGRRTSPLPTNLRSVPGEKTSRFCPHPDPLPKGEGTLEDVGDCIVLEPRMTGLVLLADPPDRKHLRLIFRTERRPGKTNSVLGSARPGRGAAACRTSSFSATTGPTGWGRMP